MGRNSLGVFIANESSKTHGGFVTTSSTIELEMTFTAVSSNSRECGEGIFLCWRCVNKSRRRVLVWSALIDAGYHQKNPSDETLQQGETLKQMVTSRPQKKRKKRKPHECGFGNQ
jgi:hypothetical protein